MPKISKTHLTNLPPIRGFSKAPCVDPDYLASADLRGEPIVVMDYERTEGQIAKGDGQATLDAHAVLNTFRNAVPATTKLGWYWWPPCYFSWDVEGAHHFEKLVERTDFLAPSFYCTSDKPSDIMNCAKYWLGAISKYETHVRRLPRIGFVCPVQVFSGRACTPEEIRLQVAACKLARCDCLYVWSGEPAHCATVLGGTLSPAAAVRMQHAMAVLIGRGYRIPSPLTEEALMHELAVQSAPKLEAFAKAWTLG